MSTRRARPARPSLASRLTSSVRERSAAMGMAALPSSRAVRAQSSALREFTMTRAPARAYARAMPSPIPFVEPVTSAALPSSLPAVNSALAHRRFAQPSPHGFPAQLEQGAAFGLGNHLLRG